MKLTEQTIDSQKIFEGRVITLYKDTVKLENDATAIREVVHHNGGVCIVALTENHEIYVVNQFRYPYRTVLMEIPAGKLEKGEDPLECGKRELLEEVGVVAKNYVSLGEFYPTAGYLDEVIYTYLATDLHKSEQNLDEDEFLEVDCVHIDKLVEMVMNGEIKDGKTQTAILKTKRMIDIGTIK